LEVRGYHELTGEVLSNVNSSGTLEGEAIAWAEYLLRFES